MANRFQPPSVAAGSLIALRIVRTPPALFGPQTGQHLRQPLGHVARGKPDGMRPLGPHVVIFGSIPVAGRAVDVYPQDGRVHGGQRPGR